MAMIHFGFEYVGRDILGFKMFGNDPFVITYPFGIKTRGRIMHLALNTLKMTYLNPFWI